MNKNFKTLKFCRLCRSKINKIIDLGKVPIGNNLSKNKFISKNQKTYQLSVNKCSKCNHFQLGISVDPKILYAKNYTYLSGIGPTFIKHFSKYSNWVISKTKIKENSLVVDIGSNDGTCLNFFKNKKLRVCGVDPASEPSNIANKKGIFTINEFYTWKTNKRITKHFGKPSLITSHNVLAHIEDLSKAFYNIFHLLKDKGYFCFEIGYFRKVLENNLFDTIYHEHLDYHHANPLVEFLIRIGFSVVEINTNNMQGGTLRILCKKDKIIKISKQVRSFLKEEKKTILFKHNDILKKIQNFNINLKFTYEEMIKLKKDYFIIGYGAPTKATLISNLIKLNQKLIKYTIEDNPLKVNRYIPGTDIPIKEFPKNFVNKKIVIFIFAWNFKSDIINKLKNYDKKIELKIIVPLPKMKTYDI